MNTVAVPLTVIGGYLGAGKTTLLNHLLRHNDGRRLALIINDFGAINIDATLIERRDEQRIDLTNGCICCGMSEGFDEAVDALLAGTPRPDHIVVEASGVADVFSVAQYGHRPGLLLDGVLVVADAETVRARASDKYVATTVRRQLEAADLIVLNKIDLLDPTAVASVAHWLETQLPGVRILPATRCEVPASVLLGAHAQRINPVAARHIDAAHHPHYVSFLIESGQPCSMAQATRFMASLPDWVLRAKGYVQLDDGRTLLLQQVGRRCSLDVATLATTDATQVVLIGLHHGGERTSILKALHCLPGAELVTPEPAS